MWGLDPVLRHSLVPILTPSLTLTGIERGVEETITHSVIQEGLNTKPSWHFWFVVHPHFVQRKDSWREMPLLILM